ncbi:hypothetical protein AAES_29017 [Amazona aestiva]|uniref:Transmembrane protein 106 C-terminal domain-containing protein n=1 Tax=Amazona aestiva TaxID=12930 RepID=A0A0Q3W1I7_AMAAE|nr:hypothetical protein AAES_29017 [Amazona aestiva]
MPSALKDLGEQKLRGAAAFEGEEELTWVKLSYMGRAAQSTLERYRYVDCSTNFTASQDLLPLSPSA